MIDRHIGHQFKILYASYRIHDGCNGQNLIGAGGRFPSQLYSLDDIVAAWQQQVSVDLSTELWLLAAAEGEDEDRFFGDNRRVRLSPPDRIWWWHPRWIPLLQTSSGDHFCLDLAPGPAGQMGQIIELDNESGSPCPRIIATGWQAVLSTFADDLDAGDYCVRKSVAGGIFLPHA